MRLWPKYECRSFKWVATSYPVLGCGWIWCCPQNMWRRSAGGRAECCSCSQCSCQQRGLPPPSWTTLTLTQAKQINSFVCIFFGKYQSWISSHKFKFEIRSFRSEPATVPFPSGQQEWVWYRRCNNKIESIMNLHENFYFNLLSA